MTNLSELLGVRAPTVSSYDMRGLDRAIATAWATPNVMVSSAVDVVRSHSVGSERGTVAHGSADPAGSVKEAEPTAEESSAAAIEKFVGQRVAEALAAQRAELAAQHAAGVAAAVAEAEVRGYEVGFDAGESAGRAAREPEFASADAARAEALDSLAKTAVAMRLAARAEAAELGFELARATVGAALELSPEALRSVIERAFQAVPGGAVGSVRCHPNDATVFAKSCEGFAITTDDALAHGACEITLPGGGISSDPKRFLETLIVTARGLFGGAA